ncbi:DUF561 domain-containing protein, partial [bacterium]|nr:DUF561 domain-containing protein [bacterium]
MLQNFLQKGKCFKLICGAGNQNTNEIEKLVAVYVKAGCRFFDIAADEHIFNALQKGIEKSGIKEKIYTC